MYVNDLHRMAGEGLLAGSKVSPAGSRSGGAFSRTYSVPRSGSLWPALAIVAALFAASLHAADPSKPGLPQAQGTRQPETVASVEGKLDAQIVLALKQSRGQAPFDQPTTLEPDIPIRDGPRVLVDLNAVVSTDLLKHVEGIGGRLAPSPEPEKVIRAMLPLAELEALAARADITFIAPAQLYRISRIVPDPKAPGGFSVVKP